MRLFMPSSNLQLSKKNEDEFQEFLKTYFKDYSLSVHGIKSKNESIAKHILTEGLLFFQDTNQYGCCGTIEPCGLVMEKDCLSKAINYNFMGNEDKVNVYILLPTTVELGLKTYFLGYPKMNNTGDYPRYQEDFPCIFTEILNELNYIPKEFIFGYSKEINGERQYFINREYISFLPRKVQSSFYKEVFETVCLYVHGFSIKDFNIENELLFEKIHAHQEEHTHKLNCITNTIEEYIDLFKERKLLKKEME